MGRLRRQPRGCPILHPRGKSFSGWDAAEKRILANKEAKIKVDEEPSPHVTLAVKKHINLLAVIDKSVVKRLLQFRYDATSAAKTNANIIACFQTVDGTIRTLIANAQGLPLETPKHTSTRT